MHVAMTLVAVLLSVPIAGQVVVGPPVLLSPGFIDPIEQRGASAASNGEIILIAWDESSAHEKRRLAASLVDATTGNLILPRFEISNGTSDGRAEVASNGNDFLVVWSRNAGPPWQIVGRRFTRHGIPLEAEPFVIAERGGWPVAASNGTDWIVIWIEDEDDGLRRLRSTWITHDGLIEDRDDLAIPSYARDLAISWGRDGFLVAWTDLGRQPLPSCAWRFCAYASTIRGALLDRKGFRIGDEVIDISNRDYSPSLSALASGSEEFVVMYSMHGRLEAARLTFEGDLIGRTVDDEATLVTTHSVASTETTISFNEDLFLAAWMTNHSSYADVHAARIDRRGNLIDGPPFEYGLPLASTAAWEGEPALVKGSDGKLFLAYTEGDNAPLRVVVRLIESRTPPPRRRPVHGIRYPK